MQKKNYATVTSAAKTAAREERRLKHFLTLSATIYNLEQTIKNTEKTIEKLSKTRKVMVFEFNLYTPTDHPDHENRLKNHESDLKTTVDERIECLTKDITHYSDEIKKVQDEQNKVVSGETKMNYEDILSRARDLIAMAVEKGFCEGEYDKKEEFAEIA